MRKVNQGRNREIINLIMKLSDVTVWGIKFDGLVKKILFASSTLLVIYFQYPRY